MSLASHYVLRELVGVGGMARVYCGYHLGPYGFRSRVAIKVMEPGLENLHGLFVEEARMMTELDHPGIVKVHSLFENQGQLYIVMEFVDGTHVEKLIRDSKNQPFPLNVAVFIASEMLAALTYLHELTDAAGHPLRIVHRDVSSSNVLLSYRGAVKLTDFGVAKAKFAHRRQTRGDSFYGKFEYADPAYLDPRRENRRVDHRTDQFSAGVVLREMLTGRFTYGGSDNVDDAFAKVSDYDLPPIREFNPLVPKKLEAVVARMMSYSPDDRFQSTRECLMALHDAFRLPAAALVREQMDSWLGRMPRPRRLTLNRLTDDEVARLREALTKTQVPLSPAPEYILKETTKPIVESWHVSPKAPSSLGLRTPPPAPPGPAVALAAAVAAAGVAPPSADTDFSTLVPRKIIGVDVVDLALTQRKTVREDDQSVIIDPRLLDVPLPDLDSEPSTPGPIERAHAHACEPSTPAPIDVEETILHDAHSSTMDDTHCEPSTPAPIAFDWAMLPAGRAASDEQRQPWNEEAPVPVPPTLRVPPAQFTPVRSAQQLPWLTIGLAATTTVASLAAVVSAAVVVRSPSTTSAQSAPLSASVLVVESTPPREISFDGLSLGLTPIRRTIVSGAHQLVVGSGRDGKVVPIVLAPGEEQHLRF